MRAWISVSAEVDPAPQDWGPWTEAFAREGIEGTQELAGPSRLLGHLPPEEEGRLDALVRSLIEAGAFRVEIGEVVEEDWQEAWQQAFTAMRFGRILVRPTWSDERAAEGEIEIVIDPGQAFGTGDHATTRGCLTLLQDQPLAGLAAADIGCGTGILSIAAHRLGAAEVFAVEVERYAAAAARENMRRNGAPIAVHHGSFFDPAPEGRSYDLIVSNILSAALIALAPEAAGRLKPGGAWIVSGIVQGNWPDVLQAAEAAGFRLDRKLEEQEWVTARLLR